MHAAVHEDAARGGRKAHEEAFGVVLVAGLGTHQEWAAQVAGVDGGLGVGVAGVEAAHKAHHGHQVRVLAGHGFHSFAGGDVQRQGLFHNTCFPARSAALVWSACSVVGVTSTTASMLGSANRAS